MTLAARDSIWSIPDRDSRASAPSRDGRLDTMRGIAILMVIGIHSLQQPLNWWETLADAPLRPCVPIFLFASGYLTALSGRVPVGKRLKAALIPYAIAFVAAYIYMAWQNPAMDHRITSTLARFALAYVFVYYYVFVYVGCTFGLRLVFSASSSRGAQQSEWRLIVLLLLCVLLLVLDVQLPAVAALGSGSYFIYLWHIFIVMILRDHAELRQFGSIANFAIAYTVTALGSIVALFAVRALAPPRMIRWLGA